MKVLFTTRSFLMPIRAFITLGSIVLVSCITTIKTPREVVLGTPTDHLGDLLMEPMIEEDNEGNIYVTGFNDINPLLYKSTDQGKSWESIDMGKKEDGTTGNSDTDIAICPDGSIHKTVMNFNKGVGEGIAVASWNEKSSGWKWTMISQDTGDDRPWIVSTPQNVLHIIWNDSLGVCHSKSINSGESWVEQPRIYHNGGSSHLAVGPNGELAVRITPGSLSGHRVDKDTDLIATSINDGETWNIKNPPGTRDWISGRDPKEGVPRWVEPIAFDNRGILYYLWSEGKTLKLGISKDLGDTWKEISLVEDENIMYFPYLDAKNSGELAATWHSGSGKNLSIHMAHITVNPSTGVLKQFIQKELPFQILGPWGIDRELTSLPLGEYQPIKLLRNGNMAVVTPILIRPVDPSIEATRGFRYHPIQLIR